MFTNLNIFRNKIYTRTKCKTLLRCINSYTQLAYCRYKSKRCVQLSKANWTSLLLLNGQFFSFIVIVPLLLRGNKKHVRLCVCVDVGACRYLWQHLTMRFPNCGDCSKLWQHTHGRHNFFTELWLFEWL